ncbi:hypothetical protein EJ02DRAFT_438385 [Clathrospora elynae]|uniref:Uncharacterized protein n=1 Tax=Clathrospora elynae TaxID=706981 RepID=A0A6A5SAV4_9PLEO|nr:hypothetical protein EJ02DRAFT_438385 [Clathrospora elynae]
MTLKNLPLRSATMYAVWPIYCNGVQFGKLLVNAASVYKATTSWLLDHLERDSEWLQQQLRQYGPVSGEFMTKFAYKEYKTPTALGHSIMFFQAQPTQSILDPCGS